MTSFTAAQPEIYPVILSGGSGTRLWPLSAPAKPKQFLPVVTDRSMMQETIGRVIDIAGLKGPLIVCGANHADIVREQLEELALVPSAILLEPEGRNTAAAIAIAAEKIAQHNADAFMLVMPSDHVILDVPSFHAAIDQAMEAARSGYLVTFGIHPSHPETGYGYIAKGAPIAGVDGVHAVEKFVEKPAYATAQAYVESGQYYWNGGIFLFKASAYLDALRAHAPAIAAASKASMAHAQENGVFISPDRDAFIASPDISIDVAVMEQTDRAAVVPVNMGWSDVGSWDALWAVREQDDRKNVLRGEVIDIDAHGNLVYVDGGPPVAVIGISDSVIVSTANGVLVMPLSRAQDVKAVVDRMKGKAAT
ncbi:MAG: mannose-1-phosphate guanylyltransferase/mannose-6-phosphate isomerase [bacterium]|nr:mannose-1-phosphate guanylyltransferase/mannose-6-phosphate isomerase [bacterium]